MKNIICAVLAILSVSIVSCAANKKLVVKDRFSAISVSDNISVDFIPSSNVSIKIDAPDKYIGKIHAKIVSIKGVKTLEIYSENLNNVREKIHVDVSAPGVNTFKASDNAKITVGKNISGDKVVINAEDNAKIKVSGIQAESVLLSSEDNGHISTGNINSNGIKAISEDNGSVSIPSLTGDNLTAIAEDNGRVSVVNANLNTVKAEASDNSSVKLNGNADRVSYEAHDIGVINASDFKARYGKAKASDIATIKACVTSLESSKSDMATIKNSR